MVPNNKIHLSLIVQERSLLKYIWPIRESPIDLRYLAQLLNYQKQCPEETFMATLAKAPLLLQLVQFVLDVVTSLMILD